MDKEEVYITKGSEETKNLGQLFAKRLKNKEFIALYGNLGSGKTTFIQGLAKGLGIKRRIISPTFIIIRSYKLDKKNFYHIDLYRTKSINDLLSVGLDEIIQKRSSIIALEWAEKMEGLLPKKRTELYFKYIDENTREIKIKKYE